MRPLLPLLWCWAVAAAAAARGPSAEPIFHVFAGHAGMMNDPDGPFYDPLHGRVHLFFGVYPEPGLGPAKDQGGFRFWQHAVSNDTVYWRRLPDAIVPDGSECDATGAHSGSTTIVNGDPVILYTGSLAAPAGSPPEATGAQVQCMARPKDRTDPDLKDWLRTGPLPLKAPQGNFRGNFRDDTTGWQTTVNGTKEWRVAVGASMNFSGPRGVAAVYRSEDFRTFDPEPVAIIHGVDSQMLKLPNMWECPDLFQVDAPSIGELWALKFSADPGMQDYYVLGEMITNFVNAKAWPGKGPALIDYGSSYYASKSFEDKDGRRIIWAWVKEETECPRTERCSLQSLPRVVSVETMTIGPRDHQILKFSPLPELKKLRNATTSLNETKVQLKQGELFVLPVRSPHAELRVTVRREELARCNESALQLITLRSEGGAEQTTVRLGNLTAGSSAVHGRPADVRISIDRSKSAVPAASDSAVDSPTAHLSAQCTLQPDAKVEPLVDIHVYVDATIMEVFVQGGRVAMTTRVYPTNTNGGLALMSEGCAMELETVEAHALGSIWL